MEPWDINSSVGSGVAARRGGSVGQAAGPGHHPGPAPALAG